MTIAELILPSEILNRFEATSVAVNKEAKVIDIYMDERSNPPSSDYTYISKGFTDATVVQDFPVRGKAVYLHVRRRKWLEKETGKIITFAIDLAHEGTRLTEDFASFLKRIGSNPEQYR